MRYALKRSPTPANDQAITTLFGMLMSRSRRAVRRISSPVPSHILKRRQFWWRLRRACDAEIARRKAYNLGRRSHEQITIKPKEVRAALLHPPKTHEAMQEVMDRRAVPA